MSADWRERGFVQDSDEDEDYDSIGSQIRDDASHEHSFHRQSDGTPQNDPIKDPENQVTDFDELADSPRTLQLEREAKQSSAHHGSKSISQTASNVSAPRIEITFGNNSDVDDLDELHLDLNAPQTFLQSPRGYEPKEQPSTSQSNGLELFDIPSSPLTEPPDDLPLPESLGLSDQRPAASHRQTFRGIHLGNLTPEAPGRTLEFDESDHLRGLTNDWTGLRSFRKRNPIQLHPYVLENEQYRQTLRSRGLKPIALRRDPSTGLIENPELESKCRDEQGLQQSQSSDFQDDGSSRASSQQHSPIAEAHAHSARIGLDEDGSPGLESVITRTGKNAERIGFKRRKVAHENPNSPRLDSPSDVRVVVPSPITPHDQIDVYEVPGNLAFQEQRRPHNRNTYRKRRHKKFRFPKGLQTTQLPTPAASSDTGRVHVNSLEFDSESDVELPRPRRPASIRSISEGSEVSDNNRDQGLETLDSAALSSENEVDHMKKVRKRIKGVLPASWLRLDQKAQPNLPVSEQQDHIRSNSSPKKLGQRGVAQKVNKHSIHPSTFEQSPGIVEISSIDSDEASIQSARDTPPQINSSLPPYSRVQSDMTFENDTQDIPEDSTIDAMIPTQSRPRSHSTGRKRQTRLTNIFNQEIGGRLEYPTSPPAEGASIKNHKRRPDTVTSRTLRQRRFKKKPLPKLSILDVTDEVSSIAQPDFIRLACRQARQNVDKGRQIPSGKILSLHNWDDQTELDSYIRKWREGRIRPSSRHENASSFNREPLSERSQNYSHALTSPTKQKLPTGASLGYISRFTKKSIGQPHPRLRQSKLNHSLADVEPKDTTPVERHEQSVERPKVHTRKTSHFDSNWRRPGQLEDLQAEDDQDYHTFAFRRDLLALNDRFANERGPKRSPANPLLDRFLIEEPNAGSSENENASPMQTATSQVDHPMPKNRRRRKSVPYQILADRDVRYRMVGKDSSPDPNLLAKSQFTQLGDQQPTIVGLAAYGMIFPTDFGIKALPFGTFFDVTTFIGSGELKDALVLVNRNLLEPTRSTTIMCGSQSYEWGPWTEEISLQLRNVLASVRDDLKALTLASEQPASPQKLNSYTTLRAIAKFYAKFLNFYDLIDADSCVGQSLEAFEHLLSFFEEPLPPLSDPWRLQKLNEWLGCLSLLSVIAYELHQISVHCGAEKTISSNLRGVMGRTARLIISHILETRMDDVRSTLSAIEDLSIRQRGIDSNQQPVEAIVILHHLTKDTDDSELRFWSLINGCYSKQSLSTSVNMTQFERVWYDTFSLLPAIQFDAAGILPHQSSFESSAESWSTIKVMLNRLFELYSGDLDGYSSNINAYIRATLRRCFVLINDWKWYKSEPMLNCVFDFFAHRGLSLLQFEEDRGTNSFLEQLDETDLPKLKADDRSFDIFLKLLATGLLTMREVYSYKKIRNIAWRFIPNHGRSHDKENDLRKEDLDALRNHHNILCVLYYASPPSFRPSLQLIRRLVDFKHSHSEACRLNVKSWSNLTRFFLSLREPDASHQEFCAWYNEVLSQLISQHQYARTEAETLIAATANDTIPVQRESIEPIIASNQQQVEGVLATLLGCFKELLRNSKTAPSALKLFEETRTAEVFKMFSKSQKRIDAILVLALDVYQSYAGLLSMKASVASTMQQDSEESQDYGEWPSLDDVEGFDEATSDPAFEKSQPSFRLLHSVLSNVFGTENFHGDLLLEKTAETWVIFCQRQVKSGRHTWNHYIDQHGPDSWFQLRDTDSTRKFMPYVFSQILDLDSENFHDSEEPYISAWLVSLMDREAMLKHQHTLTASLLNAASESVILQNLPFARDARSGFFSIKLQDLRARRLQLISQILLNIRTSVEDAFLGNSPKLSELRNQYVSVLRKMMNAMKRNFQETQQSSAVRGNYIEFVQQVVEYLQQYTSEICPVDKFFTDSAAFPLPANDPTYVVARLKGYGLKLVDERNQKKLAVFVQAVCERAILDNQQGYLIDQFKKAVNGDFYHGESSGVTLRQFLLTAVFPSYLASAINTDCGWIFAVPVLEATEYMIKDLLFSFNTVSSEAAKLVAFMLHSVLETLQQICRDLSLRPALCFESCIMIILALIANTVTASLSIVDYIYRAFGESVSVDSHMDAIEYITEFLDRLAADHDTSRPGNQLLGDAQAAAITSLAELLTWLPLKVGQQSDSRTGVIRAFCAQELREMLTRAWRRTNAAAADALGVEKYTYSVLRGNSSREVTLDVKSFEEAHGDFVDATRRLVQGVRLMPCFSE